MTSNDDAPVPTVDAKRLERAWEMVYTENFDNRGRREPWNTRTVLDLAVDRDDAFDENSLVTMGSLGTWRSRCLYQYVRDENGRRLHHMLHRTTAPLDFAAAYWYMKLEGEEEEGRKRRKGRRERKKGKKRKSKTTTTTTT